MDGVPGPDKLGELDNAQRYSQSEIDAIAREARAFVTGPKDAGKVYCPFCKLRESRWRRHIDPATPGLVRLFVYCTQCHKTGVTTIDSSIPVKVGVWTRIWRALRGG